MSKHAALPLITTDKYPLRHPYPLRDFVVFGASVVATLLLIVSCKPAATHGSGGTPSSEDRQSPAGSDSSRQPNVSELTSFLRAGLPATARLVDVKMDPPQRMPNTSPASNTWIFSVKLTLAPTEDLLGLSTEEDARAFQAVGDELAALVRWRDAFVHSPYARLYSSFEIAAPAVPMPRLLVLLHKANQPLPPIYGKMAAEWQVDHWSFSQVDLNMPEPGRSRTDFPGTTLIEGSPEAQKFLAETKAAIDSAQPKKAAIDSAYTAALVQATRPGTIYQGQITHRGSTVAAEVRFLPAPVGVDSPSVGLEVRLPATPGEVFLYSAHLSQQVPLAPAAVTSAGEPAPTPVGAEAMPQADLRLRFVSASGKEGAYSETIPVALLNLQRHYAQPDAVSLHLFERHLEGRLNGFVTDPAGFVLKAQQQAP